MGEVKARKCDKARGGDLWGREEPVKLLTNLPVKMYMGRASGTCRCGSRGREQGVHTPPEMTCGFLIQLVLCPKKTMWFIGVEVEQETSAAPPKKNPGSAPDLGTSLLVSRRYSLHARFSFQASERASA